MYPANEPLPRVEEGSVSLMWKIPIIEQNPQVCISKPETEDPLHDLRSLPNFYMADYSVQGIVVDSLAETGRILEANGYRVEVSNAKHRAEVTVDAPGRLWDILELLRGSGISSSVGDTIDNIYRG